MHFNSVSPGLELKTRLKIMLTIMSYDLNQFNDPHGVNRIPQQYVEVEIERGLHKHTTCTNELISFL